MKLRNRASLLVLVIPFLIITACKKDNKNSQPTVIYGPVAPLSQGTMRSFVVMGTAGKPETIGVKFSASSLNSLPTDGTQEWEFPLELPVEAKITGFDHLAVDWNPHGHEPTPIYGLPHFDFHYYRVSKTELALVVPGPDMTPVPVNYAPQDYKSGVIAVPNMGVHWVDTLAPEFTGKPFTNTFIYGFYHGQLTFMEPMVTLTTLQGQSDVKLNIKQPKDFQKSVYYPALTHISYDGTAKEYTMALEGLRWVDAK